MKSAAVFNDVVLANSVCGCFTAVSLSAPRDSLPAKDDRPLCSPDETTAVTSTTAEAKAHQPSR